MNQVKSILLITITMLFTVLVAVNHQVPGEYSTIQAALDASAGGDTVFVAPGIYYENLNWPQVDGIKLISTGTRENTIIDGNHAGRVLGIISPWSAPVITQATLVSGFTLRNGLGMMNGVGINCYYASPTLKNLIIAFNKSQEMGSGGGLYCYNASPMVEDVIIVHNDAYSGGGAHIDPVSSPVFNNCIFADNTLYSPGGSYAAGIYGRYEVYFQLNHCLVTRNRSWTTSAVHLGEVCTPTLSHTTITDNYNGILIVTNGSINMQYCNIADNDNYGLWLLNAGPVTTQHNWWGNANGPYHETLNPSGNGNTVVGTVNFTDWLTLPDETAPMTPPRNLSLVSVQDHSAVISWEASTDATLDHYEISYGTDTLAVFLPHIINIVPESTISIPINDLASGTNYVIQVAAVGSNNRSWFSNRIIVHTTGTAASDPVAPLASFGNYPNPFSQHTAIRFEVKQPQKIHLKIYNVKGQVVRTLINGSKVSGTQQAHWDGLDDFGKSVASGVYFARVESGLSSAQIKMLLIK